MKEILKVFIGLITFTLKTKFSRWFEVGCGILIYLDLSTVIYSIVRIIQKW